MRVFGLFGKESYSVECARCHESVTINREEVEAGGYKCPVCNGANAIPDSVRAEYKKNRAQDEVRRQEQERKQEPDSRAEAILKRGCLIGCVALIVIGLILVAYVDSCRLKGRTERLEKPREPPAHAAAIRGCLNHTFGDPALGYSVRRMIDGVIGIWRIENPGKNIRRAEQVATDVKYGWWRVTISVYPEGEKTSHYVFEYNPETDEIRLSSEAAKQLFGGF